VVRLTAAARQEFLKAVSYYEGIRQGLGSRFHKSATAAFKKSSEFPLHGKPGVASTRRILVEGFPLAVVYTEESTEIVVHAVAHLSRKPGYWIGRLKNEN
jgi:plasmid stabilization system protein ParE